MLASFKNLLRTPVGKLIMMIIIVGMAAWGVDEVFNQLRSGIGSNIARAGTRSLEPADFDRRVDAILRNINASSEAAISKSEALETGLLDEILKFEKDRLVRLGYGESLGLSPSTEAVLAELDNITAFQNPLTGELDPVIFRERINQMRMTPAQFELQLQDEILLETLRTAGLSAVYGPQALVALQARYLGETRDVAWFFYDASTADAPPPPTDEEIRAYYEANLEQLRVPERRALDVLNVSVDDFTGSVEVSEQEIATVYEATKSEQFSEPDQRTFVEMLFPTRDLARNAFGLLAGGADPNTVPGASSVNMRTARSAEISNDPLREAMFGPGRQSGAMFGPREMNGQWLVTRLISVQPGAVKPLEEVAEEIRLNLARERARFQMSQAMETLEERMAAGFDIEMIAEELSVPLLSLIPIDPDGVSETGVRFETFAQFPQALTQAFQLPVGELSSRFDAGGALLLVSPRGVVGSFLPELDLVRERVRARMVAERRANATTLAVDGLTNRIRSGSVTFEAAALETGGEIETLPEPVSRMNAQAMGVPPPLMQAAFSNREGDIVTIPTGNSDLFAILSVRSVSPPSDSILAGLGASANSEITNALQADLEQALDGEIRQTIRLRENNAAIAAYRQSVSANR